MSVMPVAHGTRIVRYPLQPRLVEVRQVTHLAARMVRITLGGDVLADFQNGERGAHDDHVKLCFPEPGTEDLPVLPAFGPADGPKVTGGRTPIMRDYTVRAWRPERLEVDIDIALHGHGVGSAWARSAAPGMILGMVGPRGSLLYTFDYDWYLLGSDETGLPALARLLEDLPAGTPVTAIVEVADETDEIPLATDADLTLTWLHRADLEPGSASALEGAVRAYAPPPGDGLAWLAGEATDLAPIRRYLRRELGLPKERVDVSGYWKRGVVDFDHHEDDTGDDD